MPTPYCISVYIAAEIEAEHPALWATIGKYFPDVSEERQALIGSLVLSTCGSCHDAGRDCQCWNDE